jgi:serine/threonine-protein kinase HipA
MRAFWTGRRDGDRGHFSLAGAQPKMALLFDGKRWGVPSGRRATTHILKPPMPHLRGTTENEYACLRLANHVGITAAEVKVGKFGEEVAIVVTRYDREIDKDGVVRRFHQEDMQRGAVGDHRRRCLLRVRDGSPAQAGFQRSRQSGPRRGDARIDLNR